MFSIKPVQVKVFDQDLTVKPLPVTRMLVYRNDYNAINDEDVAGILALMQRLILEVVVHPVLTVKELDEMGQANLKTLFDAVAVGCGLVPEKNV